MAVYCFVSICVFCSLHNTMNIKYFSSLIVLFPLWYIVIEEFLVHSICSKEFLITFVKKLRYSCFSLIVIIFVKPGCCI